MTGNIMGTPSCVQCRSTDVSMHGNATWDDALQRWTMQTADLGGTQCANCGPTALRWSRGLRVGDYEPLAQPVGYVRENRTALDTSPRTNKGALPDANLGDLWAVLITGFAALALIAVAFAVFARPAHSEGLRAEAVQPVVNMLCNFDMGAKLTFTASTNLLERVDHKFGYKRVQVGKSFALDKSSIDGVLATSARIGNHISVTSPGIVDRTVVIENIQIKSSIATVVATYEERRRTGGIFSVSTAIGTCWMDK